MLGEDVSVLLYGLMGAILAVVLLSAGVMVLLRRRQKRKRNLSMTVSGTDRSEIAERLTEKFRNERTREE